MLKTYLNDYNPSKALIFYNQFIRFIKVGRSLHFIALLGIGLFFLGLYKFDPIRLPLFEFSNYFWGLIVVFGSTLPIFAELDAYGRYQDYKLLKDKIYKNGYDNRLIKIFMYSKCQRDSVLVAAEDLNYINKAEDFFYKSGYRWYHILPDRFVKNPFVIFRKEFWYKILFTKKYQLQNFYW
jgi:hypothetical protein